MWHKPVGIVPYILKVFIITLVKLNTGHCTHCIINMKHKVGPIAEPTYSRQKISLTHSRTQGLFGKPDALDYSN